MYRFNIILHIICDFITTCVHTCQKLMHKLEQMPYNEEVFLS